jgi:DNA adenine methylase
MMSFLRWAGSKRQLLPILTEIIREDFERYVEPFAGSACVFFELLPDKALLSDINAELMRTYVEVKYRVEGVIDQLGQWHKSKKRYFDLRALDPKSLPSATRAAQFIYLNRCCFNGLYRTNHEGQFNVPYGGKRSGRIPNAEMLRSASQALKKARLITADFEKSLQQVERGDFVYMDPPYVYSNRKDRGEYGVGCFSCADLVRLSRVLRRVDEKGAFFLLSYLDCEEIGQYLNEWKVIRVPVRRQIASFVSKRAVVNEVLVSNY